MKRKRIYWRDWDKSILLRNEPGRISITVDHDNACTKDFQQVPVHDNLW